jgi:hypothetical protein
MHDGLNFALSLFNTRSDNRPKPLTLPWGEWRSDFFMQRDVRADKDGPAYSPASFAPGATRANKHVTQLAAVVLDLDHTTPEGLAAAEGAFGRWEHVIHSTHSHTPERPSARIVLPFARPVLPADWPRTYATVASLTGGAADKATKDASRLFYFPSAPSTAGHFARWNPGELLDPDALPRPADAPRQSPIGPVDLTELRWRLRSYTNPELRGAFAAVLKGKPFAEPGQRDIVLTRLCGVVAGMAINELPEVLATIFQESIVAMSAEPGAMTMDLVRQKIARAQSKLREKHAEEARTQRTDEEVRIRLATGGRRGEPYTTEEIAAFAAQQGCSAEEFARRWIIQKGGSFYLSVAGAYKPPVSQQELVAAAHQYLAPSPCQLRVPKANGTMRDMNPTELVKTYGTVAQRVVADLSLQVGRYEEQTGTFFEAACPLRQLAPLHNPQIEQWLTLLGGEDADTLLDWVAAVTRLDQQCCALYIHGDMGGEGKGLIGRGLARLWTIGGPTELARIIEGWNADLARCPLVWVDEQMPKRWRGAGASAELRSLIGSSARTLARKYLDNAELLGAVRLFLAANNENLLDFNEDLSPGDLQALSSRFLYVRAADEARDFLQAIPKKIRDSWVDNDLLARHALWLRDNRQIREGRRFLVEGKESTMHRTLATQTGLSGLVCEWLVGYLMHPDEIDRTRKGLISRGGGHLAINTRVISDTWEMFVKSDKVPTLHRLGRTLRNLSTRKAVRLVDGVQAKMYEINLPYILEWADRVGFGDLERIKRAVNIPVLVGEEVTNDSEKKSFVTSPAPPQAMVDEPSWPSHAQPTALGTDGWLL